MEETIQARGHPNVTAKHETTIEFTTENELTPRGDCIIAVAATKACAQLSEEFKKALKRGDTVLEVTIECGGFKEKITARGHPNLTLTHPADAVIRKSAFTCERTLAVHADKAASDLDRMLVEKMKSGQKVLLTLNAKI